MSPNHPSSSCHSGLESTSFALSECNRSNVFVIVYRVLIPCISCTGKIEQGTFDGCKEAFSTWISEVPSSNCYTCSHDRKEWVGSFFYD